MPIVKTGDKVTVNEPIAQAVPNSLYNGIVGNIELAYRKMGMDTLTPMQLNLEPVIALPLPQHLERWF